MLSWLAWGALALSALILSSTAAGGVEEGVIRLGGTARTEAPGPEEQVKVGAARHAFDHAAFEAQLESLWFQRKTFLADGREEDARKQLERIRAFCVEEGVGRLEPYAGALVAEARRYLREGNGEQALAALAFAETFDPGRPQVHLARAAVHWKLGTNKPAAVSEVLAAFLAGWLRGARELSLLHQLAFVAGVAFAGAFCAFSLLMLVRHQIAFRHDVEEWCARFMDWGYCTVAGWAVLAAPLLLWLPAGWSPIYWMVATFRYMSRSERATALVLLLVASFTVPLFNVSVALYGTSADPAVRTTIASVEGSYDPDRIVKLQRLVEAHPDDPVYRFLLAGLYKNGRFFEEAFAEYKRVVDLDGGLVQAHVNMGNIFFATGQYAEAIGNYRRAIERDASSFLAWFNLHLAQSESFRFKEAEESLARARDLDGARVTAMLSDGATSGERLQARDATIEIGSIWQSAVAGRQSLHFTGSTAPTGQELVRGLLNPMTIAGFIALSLCLVSGIMARKRRPARRCIRCGNPFCSQCKSSQEGHEYCTQCLHLFVKKDGLAPGTKQRKMYEVERHEKRTRRLRQLWGLILPGASQVLRGRPVRGFAFMLAWAAVIGAALPWMLGSTTRSFGLDTLSGVLWAGRDVPRVYDVQPLALLALASAPVLWLVANLTGHRRRET